MRKKRAKPTCPDCGTNDNVYRMRRRWRRTRGDYETIWCCSKCNTKFKMVKKEVTDE